MSSGILAPTSEPLAGAESSPQEQHGPGRWQAVLSAWTVGLLALGVGARLLRYLQQFPFWGDEGYLCLNLLDQTYGGVLGGLRHAQVAPLFFLWGELTAYRLLGGSELAMRLLPVLAGVAALFVFWRLARLLLSPAAATLAVGLLAVAYYPVRHTCEVKPYSFDLLMTALLLLAAVAWMREPRRTGRLAWLCLLVVPALGFSNPVVFVAGGVSLALVPTLWRLGDRGAWLWWLCYNALVAGGFLVFLRINANMQTAETQATLTNYWAEAFPPVDPLAFAKWFAGVHTGNLMAYPVGGKNGGSTLTLLLFAVGAASWGRLRRWDDLTLCLVPFGLTLLAACLHRYPYGVSARVSQHLAPAICLLTAAGVTAAIDALCRSERLRERWVVVALGLLAVVGLGGVGRDLLQPFKTDEDRLGYQIVRRVTAPLAASCPLILLNQPEQVQPPTQWYLRQLHPAVYWGDEVDWEGLAETGAEAVLVQVSYHEAAPPSVPTPLGDGRRPWRLARRDVYSRPLATYRVTEFCVASHWVCARADAPGGAPLQAGLAPETSQGQGQRKGGPR